MKLLLLLLLSLPAYGQILDPIFQAPPAGVTTPTLAQAVVTNTTSSTVVNAVYGSAVGVNDCLYAAVFFYVTLGRTITSVVATTNGALTLVKGGGPEGAGFYVAWYKVKATSGVADTITATFSGAPAPTAAIHIYDFNQMSCTNTGSSSLDDGTTGALQNPDSGSLVTVNGKLILGAILKSGNVPTGAAGLTDSGQTSSTWYERSGYRIASGTSNTAGWTSAGANLYEAVGIGEQ